jgi:hypothetical protein
MASGIDFPYVAGLQAGRPFGIRSVAEFGRSLASAVAGLGAGGGVRLKLAPGEYTLSGSVSVPAHVSLDFEPGAVLVVPTGVTLTIAGPIVARRWQIFSMTGGTLTLQGRARDRGYPEWWGITGANDHLAFQAAANAGVKRLVCRGGADAQSASFSGGIATKATADPAWNNLFTYSGSISLSAGGSATVSFSYRASSGDSWTSAATDVAYTNGGGSTAAQAVSVAATIRRPPAGAQFRMEITALSGTAALTATAVSWTPPTYCGTLGGDGRPAGVVSLRSDMEIRAKGTSFYDISFFASSTTSHVTFTGGRFRCSGTTLATKGGYVLNMSGQHIRVSDVSMFGWWDTGIQINNTGEHVILDRVTIDFSVGDGIQVSGRNLRLSNIFIRLLDDGIVVKAVSAEADNLPTHNIAISNVVIENAATGFAIGTQVAWWDAVRNVSVSNLACTAVRSPVYIKAGKLPGAGKGGGVVENIAIANLTVHELPGVSPARVSRPVEIYASHGCTVRSVRVCDVLVRARWRPDQAAYGVYIWTDGAETMTHNGATRYSRIDGVQVSGVRIVDLYEGKAEGVATSSGEIATGGPLGIGVVVEELSYDPVTKAGLITNVSVTDCEVDGAQQHAFRFSCPSYGPTSAPESLESEVYTDGLRGPRVAQQSASFAGFRVGATTAVRIGTNNRFDWAATGGNAYNIDATATIRLPVSSTISFPDTPAGSASEAPVFVAPMQCQVLQISVVNAAAVSTSDANYTEPVARNVAAGLPMATAVTKTTPVAGKKSTSFPLYGEATLHDGYLLDALSRFARGQTIKFTKADTGAGAATTAMRVYVRYLPY